MRRVDGGFAQAVTVLGPPGRCRQPVSTPRCYACNDAALHTAALPLCHLAHPDRLHIVLDRSEYTYVAELAYPGQLLDLVSCTPFAVHCNCT